MSRACVNEAEELLGIALACRLYPQSRLSVRIVGTIVKMLHRADPA
jgi:hypothetical protein